MHLLWMLMHLKMLVGFVLGQGWMQCRVGGGVIGEKEKENKLRQESYFSFSHHDGDKLIIPI